MICLVINVNWCPNAVICFLGRVGWPLGKNGVCHQDPSRRIFKPRCLSKKVNIPKIFGTFRALSLLFTEK